MLEVKCIHLSKDKHHEYIYVCANVLCKGLSCRESTIQRFCSQRIAALSLISPSCKFKACATLFNLSKTVPRDYCLIPSSVFPFFLSGISSHQLFPVVYETPSVYLSWV
ncbi:hypothetical protein AMECASPLE_026178 [Ameca splendens]|uniref:Uncharacterized protein n=1 Tax=Ameca splendens TaxID=208324 RepID=A0ABV0XTR2_9TELE